MEIILKDGSYYEIEQSDLISWQRTYHECNVYHEINAAKEKFVESQMGPYYKYGIESMVEEEPEETPLQNQGIFSILAKPTYEGVL